MFGTDKGYSFNSLPVLLSSLNFIYFTTYINHARWHLCLRSDGLRVGGNQSARSNPSCLTWWPNDHLTCRRLVLNLGRSGEGQVRYHYANQPALVLVSSALLKYKDDICFVNAGFGLVFTSLVFHFILVIPQARHDPTTTYRFIGKQQKSWF